MIEKFAESIAKLAKPGLISHIGPDGDAIGSQLGLCAWFRSRGVEPMLFNDDPVPYNLQWLNGQELIRKPTEQLMAECDGFVLIDGNEPGRFGAMSEYLRDTEKRRYLIDHHPDAPDGFYEAMLWDDRAGSTAFLVWQLFEATSPDALSREAAEALYTGILTDTGSFRFDSVTAATHQAIAGIVRIGEIAPSEIYRRVYESKSLAEFHMLGSALKGIRLFCDDAVAAIQVTEKMLSENGCTRGDLEGFVNYPLGIHGVVVSLLFCECEGRVKISLRGKSQVDLNKVARKFNGGGHFNAAGAWHDGPLSTAVKSVVGEIAVRLKKRR